MNRKVVKYKILVKEKINNPKKAFHKEAFQNEDGAIDLASIMVGIIVIGLIGGVIAATVFAVIPWTQDNAAKQQLDSVVAAESAYMGLSSSVPPGTPAGHTPNSYADSAKLAEANLMNQGDTYCATVTDEGKGYAAFAQAASGNIWSVTSANTKPVPILAGSVPTDCQFILTSGSTPAATPAPTPVSNGFSTLTLTAQAGSPTANNGNGNYYDIASNADGSTLLATSNIGYIFKSLDSGVTWNNLPEHGSASWQGIAISGDAQHITVANWNGYVYVTNNGGATWTTKIGVGGWRDISMSPDGKHQVAAIEGISTYHSHDYGQTWQIGNNGAFNWKSIDVSNDGQTIVSAANNSTQIAISKDGGVTWSLTAPVFADSYRGVSVSANGQVILAAQGGQQAGTVAVSTDGGATWKTDTTIAKDFYRGTAMSADGTKMLIVGEAWGNVYTSVDSGATWQKQETGVTANWYGATMSEDGKKLAFTSVNGQKIHTGEWK